MQRKAECIVRRTTQLLILIGLMVVLTFPTFAVHAEGGIDPQIGTETPVEASSEIAAPVAPIDPALVPEGADLLIPPVDLAAGSEELQNPDAEIPSDPTGIDPSLTPVPETNPDAVVNEEPIQPVNPDDVLDVVTEPVTSPVLAPELELLPVDPGFIGQENGVEPGAQLPLAPDPQFCSSGTPGGGTCALKRDTIAAAVADAISAGIAGIIYLEDGATFTELIDISNRATNLTLSGGWNFGNNSQGTTSTLNGAINLSNNSGTISFVNILFGSNALITVTDSADVQITGTAADDTVQLAFVGTGNSGVTVDGNGGNDTLTVNGSSGADKFTVTDNVVKLENTATHLVSYVNVENLQLNGLAGDDVFTMTSAGLVSIQVNGGDGNDEININPTVTGVANIETYNLFNFYRVSSPVNVSTAANQVVKVWNGITNVDTTVNILTIGGEAGNAFLGLFGGTASALGWNLSGVKFALAILSDVANAGRQWLALQATAATTFSFTGLAGLSLAFSDLAVTINRKAYDGISG